MSKFKKPGPPPPRSMMAESSDRFDSAYERTRHTVAVLLELANAKAGGDTPVDKEEFWFGVSALTETVRLDLEQMRVAEAAEANYIFNLDHGRRPSKGEMGARRTGGTR